MYDPLILSVEQLPGDPVWLGAQPRPVIGWGEGPASNADVLVPDLEAAHALEERILSRPLTALTLVQVLRSTEVLPSAQGLDVESLAYSTLQAGPEFAAWQRDRQLDPEPAPDEGDPILLERDGPVVRATLNRPNWRNSITIEMRDALVDTLSVLEADRSIERLELKARGACFSVGGELREFGQLPDPAQAHWVRTVHSPARMLDSLRERITAYIHGACLGSGAELPAFAARVVAHPRTYFQLPELDIGLIPGAGGTVSMTRRIGRQRMAWMVLSGKRVKAKTALAWGLVDEVADWF